ncbi:MAG: SH3 domain-containing protein [Rectinemataceae bacterium]|nr:SH3 domain-containing protein [Rectinemataceae bacterium]
MRTITICRPFSLFLIFVLGVVALSAQAIEPPASGLMTVHVAKTHIRAKPSVIGEILATVSYREQVLVYESGNGWAKVAVPGSTRYGYMFLSALTARTISPVDAGEAASGISGTEIALAGKGFNESLEESYRQNAHVDFSWVDRMESYDYPSEALVGFLAGAP